jgi:hypothetical protein
VEKLGFATYPRLVDHRCWVVAQVPGKKLKEPQDEKPTY